MEPSSFTYSYSTFRGTVKGVHFANLCLPPDEPDAATYPVLVHFHGGYWKPEWGLHNLATSTLFAGIGCGTFATWSVEYSRVNQADPSESLAGGGWPHTCLDALSALNALAALPAEIRNRLDLQRVHLCGHSAGGYLALWLGCLSRLPQLEIERIALAIGSLAGNDAAEVARASISNSILVEGVIGLAPVTSLAACATLGLSDFHDAAINFLWRAGHSAQGAIASGQLGAACPLSMWSCLPDAPLSRAPLTESSGGEVSAATPHKPLRVLLVHGLDDTDVPASLSVSLAGAAWSAPVPQPVWLLLLPGCDHYLVAGLGEVQQENPAWGTLTSAIQAFVRQEDEYLNKTACTSLTTAEPAASSAISPVCARRSMRSIVTAEPAFQQWAAAEPLSATTLARGLRRWLGWVGEEPAGVVTDWIRHHQHSEECV